MKQIISVTLILLLISCSGTKKKDLYIEYIKRFDEMIKFHDSRNDQIIHNFEKLMNDLIWGDLLKVRPWYNKAADVRSKIESFTDEIEEIKLDICESDSFNINKLHEIRNQSFEISNEKMNRLNIKSENLKNQLHSIIPNTQESETYSRIIESSINPNTWFSHSALKGSSSNSIELITVLSRIQLDIKEIESDLLNYFYYHIDACGYRFLNLVALVEPEKKEILLGEVYNADIFLGIIDTTVNPVIKVNSQNIPVSQGTGFYKKRIQTQEPGIFIEQGAIYINRRAPEDTTNIPFIIKYEVTDK